jgi:hypothetical protein
LAVLGRAAFDLPLCVALIFGAVATAIHCFSSCRCGGRCAGRVPACFAAIDVLGLRFRRTTSSSSLPAPRSNGWGQRHVDDPSRRHLHRAHAVMEAVLVGFQPLRSPSFCRTGSGRSGAVGQPLAETTGSRHGPDRARHVDLAGAAGLAGRLARR